MSIESSGTSVSPNAPRTAIGRFFFAEEVPYGLALVRMLLPLVLLIVVVHRWPYAREIYSTDGAPAPLSVGYGQPDLLPLFPGSVAVGLNTLLAVALVASSVGWCTRFSLAIATVLYAYFGLADSLSTMTKYTVIASHAMLLLTLSNCGAVWSVDRWLSGAASRNRWTKIGPPVLPRTAVWPRRLIQLLIGIVYLGAAATKLKTPTFFSGDQLISWMMTYMNHDHPLGDYLTQYPALVVISCYVTVVWEMVFIFCAWRGWGRILLLSLGLFFHFMTLLMLGLLIFPLIMAAIYLSFVNEDDVQWFARHVRRLKRRWLPRNLRASVADRLAALLPSQPPRVPVYASAGALVLLMGTCTFAGLEIEYRLDRYGLRRPEGPYELPLLSEEKVSEMFAEEIPMREEDKFLSFDLGSTLIGGRLWSRKSVFRHGDRVQTEITLNPPHGDMWIECNLHDADNRVLSRVSQIVPRESLRAHFNYTLTEALEPGTYSLVLRSRGKEIMRRHFTLLPNETVAAPVAN